MVQFLFNKEVYGGFLKLDMQCVPPQKKKSLASRIL